MRVALFAGVPISTSFIMHMSSNWEVSPIPLILPEPQRTEYKPIYVKPLTNHRLMTKPRRQSVIRGK
jgi:hypothetical protein